MHSVKIFFFKCLFFLFVLTIGVAWFMQADVGEDISMVKNIRQNLNQTIFGYIEEKRSEVVRYVDDKKQQVVKKVMDTVGYEPEVAKPEVIVVKKNPPLDKVTNPLPKADVAKENTKNTTSQEFAHLSIPFYYDHSDAPKNITKSQMLKIVEDVSQIWTEACNISFNYKGDRLTDYVDVNNTMKMREGLIKWGNLPGRAVGQAHQGNSRSYAHGFILTLKPSYFANMQHEYIHATVLHEAGHVIGFPHSTNNRSIMYWQQSHNKQVLNNTDKAMCKYFRGRWQGLTASQAAEKYGILVNESLGNHEADEG